MYFVCVIDEVKECGYEFGYQDSVELLFVIDYVVMCVLCFSEKVLVVCLFNVLFDWLMCMLLGYVLFCDCCFNDVFEVVFNGWSVFFSGLYLCVYLNLCELDGWFSFEVIWCIGMEQFLCDLL